MEVSTIVIDNGAYTVRAGHGGESAPSVVMSSIVARPRPIPGQPPSMDVFIGSNVFSQSVPLTLKCPIEDRVIKNFDDMSRIWQAVFTDELHIQPEEHPVLMTESPQKDKSAREKALQIMMETYKVPAYYASYPEVLSLYSEGLTTGCVIDAGETVTSVLPVFECYGMTHVGKRLNIGGRQLNEYMQKLLMQSGMETNTLEREDLRDIKETLCYVAADMNEELHKLDQVAESFTLKDGRTVKLMAERFRCPEALFDPEALGTVAKGPGLSHLVAHAINATDDLKPQMLNAVMMIGGTSMFKGFEKRLENDLGRLMESGAKVKVIAPKERNKSAWIGGSVLVSLATFSQMWITKAEYDETGPSIVHLKCF